jgi:glycosyltransferase involved in cell wall biosynthesis
MGIRHMDSSKIALSIVVPCFNEAEVLPETINHLCVFLDKLMVKGLINTESRVWFVDDGSSDDTWSIILSQSSRDQRFRGIKLSRNRGHQNALLAGLLTANGDIIVSIDADLQDDIDVIEEMINSWKSGFDVVYGVRKTRECDSYFKHHSARIYYRLLNNLGVDTLYNHADFRLIGRRVIESLREYPEVNLFLRGMIRHIGFSSTIIEYDRQKRLAGESKYPLKRMLALAVDGVTSFTAAPLRFISILGAVIFLATIGMIIWVLWVRLFTGEAVPGWASLVIPICFLGGVQLLSIGVLGEYVAKIYFESKRRPRYLIDEVC